jgi:O-antigen/teichoic acid export membrane protein
LILEAFLKKSVGLVSTLILARVLTPDDFGLVAIAMLFLGFVEVFAMTGSEQYILQKQEVNNRILNTAWSLDLSLKILISCFIFGLAPFVGEYYKNQELENVLRVITFMPLIGALASPGILLLKREQKYLPIIKVSFITKLLAVFVTISIAVIYESYWALIIGTLLTKTSETIGSYLITRHRPRFTLCEVKEQLAFSGWMTPQAIIGYARTQLDTFIVSSTFGAKQLGAYHVIKYLAFMPTSEVLAPATQPLLVELAKVKNNKKDFIYQYRLSFLVTLLLAIPIVSFLLAFDKLTIQFLLGSQWLEFSNLLGTLSGLVIALVILNQSRRVLIVFQKTKLMFYYELASFTAIYSVLFIVGFDDLYIFANSRVILENVFCIALFIAVAYKYIGLKNLITLTLMCIPIFISAAIAALTTKYAIPNLTSVLGEFILTGVCFLSLYLIYISGFYSLFYRKTEEGRHVYRLVLTAIYALKNK